MTDRYADRADAGRRLADELLAHFPYLAETEPRPLVLGLPRGGVVVAAEVARRLGVPLDVLIVRKVGHPLQPEVAIGSIGPDGTLLLGLHPAYDNLAQDEVNEAVGKARAEWEERNRLLRQGRRELDVSGRPVIVVDDGVATGATAVSALRWLCREGARPIIMAVPVGPLDVGEIFTEVADHVVCPMALASFRAVGQAYRDFHQTEDDEVLRLLSPVTGP